VPFGQEVFLEQESFLEEEIAMSMNKLGILLAVAVVFSGISAAIALPMEGGPYSPSTEPYAACSRDGFSGVQGQNGWYYGYVKHGDTWSSPITNYITLFDKFDPGQGPSGQWSVQNPGPNQNLLYINELGQSKAGGADPYNTVRYWVADQTIAASEVVGGYFHGTHQPSDIRLWIKIQDGVTGATATIQDDWQSADGIHYQFANQQIDPGDLVLFGVGHSGVNQASDGYIQPWHVHITPEPATAALLVLGGLALVRRRQRA
jgi:hypothetical protein